MHQIIHSKASPEVIAEDQSPDPPRLAVKPMMRVHPVLNREIETAQKGGTVIVASRDWHPPDHASFKEQGGRSSGVSGPGPSQAPRWTVGAVPDVVTAFSTKCLSRA